MFLQFKPNISRLMFSYICLFLLLLLILFSIKIISPLFLDFSLDPWLTYGFYVFIFLGILYGFYKWKILENTNYILSNKYLFYSHNFINEYKITIPTKQITDVTYSRGLLFDRIFKTGSLMIYTSGSILSDLVLDGVKDYTYYYDQLNKVLKVGDSLSISESGKAIDSKASPATFLTRVQPYLPVAMFVSSFKSVLSGIALIYFLIIPTIGSYFFEFYTVSALFLLTIIILIAWLSTSVFYFYQKYSRTYYDFYKNKVEYYHGFLILKKQTIPLVRITNIDSNQNFFERILGVKKIFIETAGSNSPSIVITYVKDDSDLVVYLKEVLKKHGRN